MRVKTLGELCNIASGGTPSRSQSSYWNDGTIPWIKIGNIKGKYVGNADEYITQEGLDNSSAKMFSKGTILYTIFATLGEVGILTIDACTNQAIAGIAIKDPSEVLSDYLFYYLKSKKAYVNGIGRGVAQNNINMSILRGFEVPLPSISEQRQIVSVLDALSKVIGFRQKQLTELDNLIKARFVELTESTDTVPTKMGDIATYINGYAFKPVQWEDAGYPIVRIQNLNDANAPYNYYSGKIADKYLIHNGDVLVSWATHLEAYIWKGEEAWLNQHIFKVVFDKIEVDKTYFVYACEEALRQAFRNAHGFKPTMEHIKKADFDAAVVKLPEMHIQKEFATFVKQVDKSKVVVQKAISKSYSLI